MGGPAPWPPLGWQALHLVWKKRSPREAPAALPAPGVEHPTAMAAATSTPPTKTMRDDDNVRTGGPLEDSPPRPLQAPLVLETVEPYRRCPTGLKRPCPAPRPHLADVGRSGGLWVPDPPRPSPVNATADHAPLTTNTGAVAPGTGAARHQLAGAVDVDAAAVDDQSDAVAAAAAAAVATAATVTAVTTVAAEATTGVAVEFDGSAAAAAAAADAHAAAHAAVATATASARHQRGPSQGDEGAVGHDDAVR